VPNNRLFFRPGLIDWKAAAELFGRAGEFYAGNDPNADFKPFLDACAASTQGFVWQAPANDKRKDVVHAAATGSAATCGALFARVVDPFLADSDAGRVPAKRLDETIGASGVDVLAVTSLITGDSVDAYKKALDVYHAGTVA